MGAENQLPGYELRLDRIRVVETSVLEDEPQRCLEVRFVHLGPDSNKPPSVEGKVIDEHGCTLASRVSSYDGKTVGLSFGVIPWASRRFEVQLTRENYGNNPGLPSRGSGSYHLTNLISVAPAEWWVQPLSAARQRHV